MMYQDPLNCDFYDILNVSQDASDEEIKYGYREMSRLYHPDKMINRNVKVKTFEELMNDNDGTNFGNGGYNIELINKPEAFKTSEHSTAFLKISQAYRVLSDKTLRKFYDKYGIQGVKLVDDVRNEVYKESGINNDGNIESIVKFDDSIEELERRVRCLLRKRDELNVQRLFNLRGFFTLALMANLLKNDINIYNKLLQMQYTSSSQSIQINVNSRNSIVLGYSTHYQGAVAGAAKFSFYYFYQCCPLFNIRFALHTHGISLLSSLECQLSQHINDNCCFSQKIYADDNGLSATISWAHDFADNQHGVLSWTIGSETAISCIYGLKLENHSYRLGIEISEDDLYLTAKSKYFTSYKTHVTLTAQYGLIHGLSNEIILSYVPNLMDNLTKIYYGIMFNNKGFVLKLRLTRGGLSFNFPLQLYVSEHNDLLQSRLMIYFLCFASIPPITVMAINLAYNSIKKFDLLRKIQTIISRTVSESFPLIGRKLVGKYEEFEQNKGRSDLITNSPSYELHKTSEAAFEEIVMLKKIADKNFSIEVSKEGLIVEKALYGHPEYLSADADCGLYITNVTVPIMAKVLRSLNYIYLRHPSQHYWDFLIHVHTLIYSRRF